MLGSMICNPEIFILKLDRFYKPEFKVSMGRGLWSFFRASWF